MSARSATTPARYARTSGRDGQRQIIAFEDHPLLQRRLEFLLNGGSLRVTGSLDLAEQGLRDVGLEAKAAAQDLLESGF